MFKFRVVAFAVGMVVVLWGGAVFADEQGHMHGGDMQHEKMADTQMKGDVLLKGEVIDIGCYVSMDAKGADHAMCGQMCAKQGAPLSVLDEKTGQIYLILAAKMGTDPKEKVLPFIGKHVEVAGKADTKGGVKTITVQTIHHNHDK